MCPKRCFQLVALVVTFASVLIGQDVWYWRSPTPTGSRIVSYAVGQGLFVGVGESGTIASSPDGTNWTLRESNVLADLKKVIFDGTRFVAVGEASVLTSNDGKTWSASTAPANLADLAYGNGRYVAISQPASMEARGQFVISTDAISWSLVDAPFSSDPQSVVFSKNLFVAAGNPGDLLTSTDGLSWNHVVISGATTGYSPYLVADSNRFLVTWRGPIYYSDNSSVWQEVSGPALSYNGVLGYAGGKFFVDEGRHRRGVGFSSDGLAWTFPSNTTDEYAPYYIDFHTVAYGANTYVATEVPYFYAVPNSNSYSIHTSVDGQTWTGGNTTLFSANQTGGEPIVYGLGRYFFDGKSSSDGITWVEGAIKPTHAAGARVFHFPRNGETGPSIQVSSDGLTFTTVDAAMTGSRTVAFGANRYVIVGDGGKISTSTDAQAWSNTNSTTNADLNAVIYAFNRFIAVGAAGTLLTSADGLTWTKDLATSADTDIFRRVVAGTDRLLVLGTKKPDSDGPTKLADGTKVEFATYDDAVFLNGTFLAWARVYREDEPYSWTPHVWKSTDARTWTDLTLHIGNSRYSYSTPSLASGNESAIFVSQPGTPTTTAVYHAVLQTVAPGSRAPAIVTAPSSQTAPRGETVTFSVGTTGSGSLQYQWFHDGTAVAGATRALLKLDLITDSSAGKYTVTVTNAAGSATSAAAELSVIAPTPLTITREPVGGILFDRATVELSVTAAGSGPITYQWRLNGQPIAGATGRSYTVYGSAFSHDSSIGDYDVVVTAPYSTVTSQKAAVTWGGPTASITPTGVVTRKVGESVTVTATVTGAGPFTYRWFRPGANGTIAGANSSTLELKNLMPSDSGPITLEVTDPAGHSSLFPAINLGVYADYQLSESPLNIDVSLGSAFTLGGPPYPESVGATYQWYHNGAAIPGATQSALSFARFTETDVGDYQLIYVTYLGAAPRTSPTATLRLSFARLTNLSARGFAGSGEDTLIEGFVLRGEADGDLLIRSIGPELKTFGITNAVADPYLKVLDAKRALVAENDDWSNPKLNEHSVAVSSAATSAVGAFPLSPGAKDSAVMVHLAPPGLYTTQVSTAPGSTGLVLNEIYAPPSSRQRLVNLSARARVSGGDNILIGGFVIAGTQPLKVLIRGVGPTLAAQGIAVPLMNPKITLYKGTAAIRQNDNWGQAENLPELRSAITATGAFALHEGSNDAALLLTLDPGIYSVHVTSVDGSPGVALIEIYEAP